jgi:hypothetical protein
MGISQTPQAIVPASVGGMTLISTTSLSGTSVTLSSIPTTYTDLQLVMVGMQSTGSTWYMRLNGDTGSNYDSAYLRWDTVVEGNQYTSATHFTSTLKVYNNTKTMAVIRLPHYTTTSGRQAMVNNNYGGGNLGNILMGSYGKSAAITQISFTSDGNSFTAGTAYLYGVK